MRMLLDIRMNPAFVLLLCLPPLAQADTYTFNFNSLSATTSNQSVTTASTLIAKLRSRAHYGWLCGLQHLGHRGSGR